MRQTVFTTSTRLYGRTDFSSSCQRTSSERKPIQIIKLIDNKENPFIQTRNIIILEENSQLTIVDCDDTKCHQASMINSYTEMILGENAHLENYKMQNLNDSTTLLNTNTTKQLSNSTLQSCIISFNGGRIRNNIHVDLDGEGADLQIYGLYLMDKKQHVDNQLKINHNVPNCTSNEVQGHLGQRGDRSVQRTRPRCA